MKHTIPVWCWLRFSSPARRLELVDNPLPFVTKMSRTWEALTSAWWVIVLAAVFVSVWAHPAGFWYAIPLLVSAGVLGYGLLGAVRPSEEVASDFDHLWQAPGMETKWPTRYRLTVWQMELAAELLSEECRARMQAETLGARTPVNQKCTRPVNRL